jgi:hypothetical protein
MDKLKLSDVTQYVEQNIGTFHSKRLAKLEGLELRDVIRRKNPYLFKAKNVLTSEAIVRQIVDARLSSSEETLFGDWLEGLAIFVNERVFGGRKSGIAGIDLEFDHNGARYIITIKSGPNWGNDSQIKKMKQDFTTAKRILRTSNAKVNVVAVNGCCYGRSNAVDKGEYFKYCGQRFWEFISGEPNLYIDLIKPLSHSAKEKTQEYFESYSRLINVFTKEFSDDFCDENGDINWDKLLKFNSAITPPKMAKKQTKIDLMVEDVSNSLL